MDDMFKETSELLEGYLDPPMEEPNTKLPFTVDAPGGFMFALLRFWDEGLVEENGYLPLLAITSATFWLHVVSLAFQLYLSAIMFIFVIERREDPFENVAGLAEREELLVKAIATNTPLNGTTVRESTTLQLCWNDHSVAWSQSLILFLWLCKVSVDIKDAIWVTYVSCVMPSTTNNDVISEASRDSEDTEVVRLTPCLRFVIFFFINMPRLILACIIAVVGAKFLEFATSIGVLIMKSIGLAFLIQVNQILFNALAPQRFIQLQKKASFHYHTNPEAMNWMLFGSLVTAFKAVGLALLAVFVSRFLFRDVAHFRQLCNEYEAQFRQIPIYQVNWLQINSTYLGFNFFGHILRS